MNYATIVETMGAKGIGVENPNDLPGAPAAAMAERGCLTVLDVMVARDPASMLPGGEGKEGRPRHLIREHPVCESRGGRTPDPEGVSVLI